MKKFFTLNNTLAILLSALALFNACTSIYAYREVTKLCELSSELKNSVQMGAAEAAPAPMMDTSDIDMWCGDYPDGKVRMTGAWVYGKTSNGENLLQDERGDLWVVDYTTSEDGFYLLWIADNNTPDTVKDDIVIQVWTQVYE